LQVAEKLAVLKGHGFGRAKNQAKLAPAGFRRRGNLQSGLCKRARLQSGRMGSQMRAGFSPCLVDDFEKAQLQSRRNKQKKDWTLALERI
jgi:hypothetical protein